MDAWQGWLTVGLTALVLYALVRNLAPPDFLFLGAVVLLALAGVISPAEAFSGFSNAGVLTVAALFVVAAALRETGVLDYVGHRLLGQVRSEGGAMARLATLVVPLSALVNNTPIVAMLVPVVIDWCRKRHISPSRLLIPLSYLAILGGTCTLIGTSTNLVVHGLLLREKMPGIGFLEIGAVGLPFALVGTAYLMLAGPRLLPQRTELIEQLGAARREYLVEMLVQPGCRLIGQSVEAAGLRQLPGLFLIEIDRAGTMIGPVAPEEVIQAQDRLVFTGVVSTIVDLEKIAGLVPAADATYGISPQQRHGRLLCEAVISPTSPLVGKKIRRANFRAIYNAAVVAVHRNGARVSNKVGEISLRPGDTLLLQAGPHFTQAHRNNPDFYLVSDVEDSRPLRHERAWLATIVFLTAVGLMAAGPYLHESAKAHPQQRALGIVPMGVTEALAGPTLVALLAAGLMVALRCISVSHARQNVDWQLLVTIASAFGLGAALRQWVAPSIAAPLVQLTGLLGPAWAPLVTLGALYLVTVLVTEMITNTAAAVLMFPFCLEASEQLGISARPFVMALALAASASFASPIGYQTNMMVYGPGGYRFTDFVRVGLPLNLMLCAVAMLLVPLWWPW